MRGDVVNLSVLLIFATILLHNHLPVALSTSSYIIVTCLLLLGIMLPSKESHHQHVAHHSELYQKSREAREQEEVIYTQAQRVRMIKEKYLGEQE